jgi:hypothetical protein
MILVRMKTRTATTVVIRSRKMIVLMHHLRIRIKHPLLDPMIGDMLLLSITMRPCQGNLKTHSVDLKGAQCRMFDHRLPQEDLQQLAPIQRKIDLCHLYPV